MLMALESNPFADSNEECADGPTLEVRVLAATSGEELWYGRLPVEATVRDVCKLVLNKSEFGHLAVKVLHGNAQLADEDELSKFQAGDVEPVVLAAVLQTKPCFVDNGRAFLKILDEGASASYSFRVAASKASWITVVMSPPVDCGRHTFTFAGVKWAPGVCWSVGVMPSPLPEDLGDTTNAAVAEELPGWALASDGTFLCNNGVPQINMDATHAWHNHTEDDHDLENQPGADCIASLFLDFDASRGKFKVPSERGGPAAVEFDFNGFILPLHVCVCLGEGGSMRLVAYEQE